MTYCFFSGFSILSVGSINTKVQNTIASFFCGCSASLHGFERMKGTMACWSMLEQMDVEAGEAEEISINGFGFVWFHDGVCLLLLLS